MGMIILFYFYFYFIIKKTFKQFKHPSKMIFIPPAFHRTCIVRLIKATAFLVQHLPTRSENITIVNSANRQAHKLRKPYYLIGASSSKVRSPRDDIEK